MRHRNTPTAMFANLLALGMMASLALSSCSSSEEPGVSSESPVIEGEESTPEEAEADEAPESDETDEAKLAAVVIFDVLVTEPTAAGPHPELAWSAVDGATSYDLVVLDGAGDPYWAWSGSATSVYLGGVQNPDAVGAWVFEPLTWIGTARDSEGEPLAMSARAELLP